MLDPWKKRYDQLDSILKSRDITLPKMVCLVRAMVLPVVMYGCESWTIKKAEYQRIHAFELWCWRRLLRVSWTARRYNQSILKETWVCIERTDAEAETPILWPAEAKNWLIKKTLMLGKIEGRRRRDDRGWDGLMESLTKWTWVWASPGS